MDKPKRPSELFTEWLDKTIESGPEGTKLGSGDELARKFGISPKTVQRILDWYRKSGKICRIRKRGTFIGKAPAIDRAEQKDCKPRQSSEQSIAGAILDGIAEGYFRKGTLLPSVKYLCLRFKCSATTVSRAYRLLEKKRQIVRIGKSFWAGSSLESIQKSTTPFSVYIFNPPYYNLKHLFTESALAQQYRTMEQVLFDAGAAIHHESISDFESIIAHLKKRKHIPKALIFLGADEEHMTDKISALKQYLHFCRPSAPAVVVDWIMGDHTILPRQTQIVNRGHALTSVCRCLAQFIVEHNYRNIEICADEPGTVWGFPQTIWPFIKIRTELKAQAPKTRLSLIVRTKSKKLTFDKWIKPIRHRINKMQFLMDKYEKTPVDMLKKEISFAGPEHILPVEDKIDLAVYARAATAAQACRYAEKNKIRIPRDISILCLEDNPEYYHEGLSLCVPDYERIGYLMGHAVLGDIPIAKTSKGFIRTFGKLTCKLTTRR